MYNPVYSLDWIIIEHKSDFSVLWEVRWNHRFWFFNQEQKAKDFLEYWKFN